MKSKYDNIKTAAELVYEVKRNGMSTKDEDICRAQDIMGHSDMDCFQDILAVNENVDTFYFILTKIWNWKDVCETWNKLTNPDRHLRSEYTQAKSAIESLENQLAVAKTNAKFEADQYFKELRRANELEKELYDKEQEIVRLKAKLYDMMESKTA